MTVLTTPRLVLRPPVPADALEIAALAGDWDIASMTGQLPYPYTLANAHRWIAELPRGDPLRAAFTITRHNQLIGVTGYTGETTASAGIGYWIGKPHWGQGFATEAATALISHCLGPLGFATIHCAHFVGNSASARVIAKLGFTPSGPCKSWCEATATERDTLRYVLNALPQVAVGVTTP
jgi:[ribosomal protein S5]-alanine N-acetyltransferase